MSLHSVRFHMFKLNFNESLSCSVANCWKKKWNSSTEHLFVLKMDYIEKLFPTSISDRKDLKIIFCEGKKNRIQNNITGCWEIKMDKQWNILFTILTTARHIYIFAIQSKTLLMWCSKCMLKLELLGLSFSFYLLFIVKSLFLKLDFCLFKRDFPILQRFILLSIVHTL